MVLRKSISKNKTDKGVIEAGGFSLQYSIEGKGKPAIVIGSALYYSRTFSQNIRNHLRLAFVDHRGFGIPPSRSLNTEEFGLEVIVDDIEHTRQVLELDNIVIHNSKT